MLAPDTAAPEADRIDPLAIRLFGPFEVRLHGQPLPRLRTRKGQWLLALLALRHGREVEREWLAGLLWPDSSETAAYASLRNSLKDLRQALGAEAGRLRSPTPRTLALDLEGADADVVAFDQALSEGDEPGLERAICLYRGPLLEGCAEEWALPERQAREQACLTALETLADRSLERSDPASAERYLRRAVALDPLRETAQRALMQALAAGGNYAAGTQVYRELRLRLHRELNVAPDPETQALYEQLRAEAKHGVGGRGSGVGSEPSFPDPRPPTPDTRFPTGTVTFFFTDIERSSQLWEQHPQAMRTALEHHDALLRQSLQAHGGLVFKTVGDAFYAAFATTPAAIAAALAAQRALMGEEWSETGPLRVRMALHTGIAEEREGDYFGPTLNRVARLLEAGHGGQVLLSLPTQELVRDELPAGASLRPLGEHRLKDLVRPEQVFQLLHPDLPTDFPPLRSLEAFAHNLPVQLTSFVGREREVAEVKRLLSGTHLLTLTGAGGCGKTRLALQVAAELVTEYGDGVWLVELAALAEPGLIPQTVAAALGVREQPNRPLNATLADQLRTRTLLLVLDNCEHLLAACAQLAEELLRSCAGLRILATSREGLQIAGETTYRVPPLSLPDLQRLLPVDLLTQFEAARLFVERATAALPSFGLTDQNAAAVAQVCHRLDGMPLALELAAARVKALPVEKIAERLDDRFRLLTGGSRTALPRQQTLQALIDWSYDLLSEAERALLRRLSVFAGGWTLEAAEAVCSGDAIEEWEVLDLLTSLVEKSLVAYEAQNGEGRYRLLETIRQYARERLLAAGEAEGLRQRHLSFFLRFAEETEPEFYGSEQGQWLKRLEAEHDNLRGALEWGWESEAVSALRVAGALGRFWDLRGYWSEAREALEREVEAPSEVRAKALQSAGWLAWRQGEHERARGLSEASLALRRELEDKQGISRSLSILGVMAWSRGDYLAARALLEESLAVLRELDDPWGTATSLSNLALVTLEQGDYPAARALLGEALAIHRAIGNRHNEAIDLLILGWVQQGQGDYEGARASFEECLAISRQIGTRDRLANALSSLGCVAWEEGDAVEARRLLEESLALARELGDKEVMARSLGFLGRVEWGHGNREAARALYEESLAINREIGYRREMSWGLQGLGDVAAAQGEYGSARILLQESLALQRELGHKRGLARGLERFAILAAAEGDPERAARLFGAAQALRDALGSPLPPVERTEYERSVTATRTQLGKEAFAAAWAEGRAMPLEEAISYALEASA